MTLSKRHAEVFQFREVPLIVALSVYTVFCSERGFLCQFIQGCSPLSLLSGSLHQVLCWGLWSIWSWFFSPSGRQVWVNLYSSTWKHLLWPAPLLKILSFFQRAFLASSSKIKCTWMHGFLSGSSVQFHWWTCLFFSSKHCAGFITISLEYMTIPPEVVLIQDCFIYLGIFLFVFCFRSLSLALLESPQDILHYLRLLLKVLVLPFLSRSFVQRATQFLKLILYPAA